MMPILNALPQKKRNIAMQSLLALLCTSVLSACSGPFSDYSDYELKRAYGECDYDNLSPAGAQRCLNIEKECEKRKKESGLRC